MAYEMVMPYHLHMPSYFLETFTEYPYLISSTTDNKKNADLMNNHNLRFLFCLLAAKPYFKVEK